MSISSSRLALALMAAALCFGTQAAHAQAAPVGYWIPGWPLGFGGGLAASPGAYTYGNFPGFDGSDSSNGLSSTRYNFSNGWFIGSQGISSGLAMNGFTQDGAFGSSFQYQSTQLGYNFQNSPVSISAGFDTLKYNSGIGGPFAPFDSANTQAAYGAHAGVEIRPTSNLSLSLGASFTQSGDGGALLPGASPLGHH